MWQLAISERKIRPIDIKMGTIKRVVRVLQVCTAIERRQVLLSLHITPILHVTSNPDLEDGCMMERV